MTVRPIRTEEDYQSALKRATALFGHKSPKDRDELEVLQAVIERWERSRHPIEAPTPVQAIKFRMAQEGLSQRDLIPYLEVNRAYPRYSTVSDSPRSIRSGHYISI